MGAKVCLDSITTKLGGVAARRLARPPAIADIVTSLHFMVELTSDKRVALGIAGNPIVKQ